jgi:hypothetical protein
MLGLERRPARPSAPLPPAARKALIATVGGTVASRTGGTHKPGMPLSLAKAIAWNLRQRGKGR